MTEHITDEELAEMASAVGRYYGLNVDESHRLIAELRAARAERDRAEEVVERIMTQHWDIATCHCWVCVDGRAAGCRPRECYLRYRTPTADQRPTVRVDKALTERFKVDL